MEGNYKNMMYLSDEEIKKLALYLAYGAGLGIFVGIFTENVTIYFSLGSVIGIVVANIVFCISKYKEKKDIKK